MTSIHDRQDGSEPENLLGMMSMTKSNHQPREGTEKVLIQMSLKGKHSILLRPKD